MLVVAIASPLEEVQCWKEKIDKSYQIVDAMVIPILTYGCEAWSLQTGHIGEYRLHRLGW